MPKQVITCPPGGRCHHVKVGKSSSWTPCGCMRTPDYGRFVSGKSESSNVMFGENKFGYMLRYHGNFCGRSAELKKIFPYIAIMRTMDPPQSVRLVDGLFSYIARSLSFNTLLLSL